MKCATKLKERQIREIKIKLLNGESQRGIARQYNISQAVISAINTGKTWSHVKIDEKSDSSNDSDTRSNDSNNWVSFVVSHSGHSDDAYSTKQIINSKEILKNEGF